MDAQDGSISKRSPEFRIDMSATEMAPEQASQDMSSKDMENDQASQDCRRTTKEVHKERSTEGMPTDKASPAGYRTTQEADKEGSSEGTATNKASQDGCNAIRDSDEESSLIGAPPSEMHGSPNAAERSTEKSFTRESSESMETHESSPDNHKTAREVRKEGSSEGMSSIVEDFCRWLKQKFVISKSKVPPSAVANKEYRPLFKAAAEGDWEEIEKILSENHTAMTAAVMNVKGVPYTMLDVAITAGQDQLVENLVKHLPQNCEDLHLDRAFLHAARGGRIRMVKALIDKINADYAIIHKGLKIVLDSALDQKEVIWYLTRHLKSKPETSTMIDVLLAGHLDICLYLARKYPELVNVEATYEVRFLEFLVTMTRYFRSGARLNFWQKSIYNFIPLYLVDMTFDDSEDPKMARALLALNQFKISLWNLVMIPAPFIQRSGESKLRHYCSLELAKLALTEMEKYTTTSELLEFILTSRVVLDAASRGVFEIVKLCLERYPELMWDNSFSKQLLKEIVKGRHVELFRLVSTYKSLGSMADDDDSTNIDLMEAVTVWSPRCESADVSGAAFLLQRELQWFQVVEVGTYSCFKWLKLQEGRKSYWEEFAERRKNLVKEAGKWMKDTSSSCSVVATLIITIAFAAAFTVPGGNNDSTGISIFPRSVLFTIFVVADAIALFCSVAATLMFLTILTSSYEIEDFHHSLPRRMVLGLTFLFLSLAFMLVAFGSTLSIVLSDRWKWIYILFTLLAGIPVVLFPILQLLPLYIEMVESTYWPRLYHPLKLSK